MGKGNLDDYFWHTRREDLQPLMVGYEQNPQTGLYKLIVTDKNGIKVSDSEEFDLDKVKKEARGLVKALGDKLFQVSLTEEQSQNH